VEKHFVFPFIIEDNLINGKTCTNCKKQKECCDAGETVAIDKTCGDWEWNSDRIQEKDEEDFLRVFDNLMNKYGISTEDGRTIYISANHF